MQKHRKHLLGLGITLVLSLLFLWIFYKSVLLSPNSYMFGTSGDGMKNYYTYAYHIVHDTSYVHFQGMNYPYGELHVFTDGNPSLSNPLKVIYQIFPGIKEYLIGIYNLWTLFGFVVAAGFLYLIIYHFTKDVWWSMLGGISVMLLSPQWIRIETNYALSSPFFIAMIFYFLLRWHKNPTWQNLLFSALSMFWVYWIHPYLGVIGSMAAGSFWLFFLLTTKPRKSGTYLLGLLISTLLPMLIYYGIVKIWDIHPNRLSSPPGFFLYQANYDSVFRTKLIPGKWLNFGEYKPKHWEGVIYIGTATRLILAVLFFYFLYRIIISKPYFLPKELVAMLFAGVISLLFGMGIPFNQYPELVNYVPLVKQFRSLARFAWTFYYIIGIFAIVFTHYLIGTKHRLLRSSILLAITLLFFWDSYTMHKHVSNKISKEPNWFLEKLKSKMKLERISPEQYQAIIPFPFFHIGSGEIKKIPYAWIRTATLITSFHTGLPTFASETARISMDETKVIRNLISPLDVSKELAPKLPNRKKLLVISQGRELNEFEEYYLNKSKPITELYSELPCEAILNKDTFFKPLPKDTLLFLTFDEKETPIKFQGKGAYYTKRARYNIIKKYKKGEVPPGIYRASCWVYLPDINNPKKYYAVPLIAETNEWVHLDLHHIDMIYGDWVYVSRVFKVPEDFKGQVAFLFFDENSLKILKIIDNLLVYRLSK